MNSKKLYPFVLAVFALIFISSCGERTPENGGTERETINAEVSSAADIRANAAQWLNLAANQNVDFTLTQIRDIGFTANDQDAIALFNQLKNPNSGVKFVNTRGTAVRSGAQLPPHYIAYPDNTYGTVFVTAETGGYIHWGANQDGEYVVVPADEQDYFQGQTNTPSDAPIVVINVSQLATLEDAGIFNSSGITLVFGGTIEGGIHNGTRTGSYGLYIPNGYFSLLYRLSMRVGIEIINPYITPGSENVRAYSFESLWTAAVRFGIVTTCGFNMRDVRGDGIQRPALFYVPDASQEDLEFWAQAFVQKTDMRVATTRADFGTDGGILNIVVPANLYLNESNAQASGLLNLSGMNNRRVNVRPTPENEHMFLRSHTDESLELLDFPGINGAVRPDGNGGYVPPVYRFTQVPQLTTVRDSQGNLPPYGIQGAAYVARREVGHGARAFDKIISAQLDKGPPLSAAADIEFKLPPFIEALTLHIVLNSAGTYNGSGPSMTGHGKLINTVIDVNSTITTVVIPDNDSRAALINRIRERAETLSLDIRNLESVYAITETEARNRGVANQIVRIR